ncbi:MAG: cyanoexosortase A system-associated protein [Stenomitos frigidus ULC029]
MAKLWQPLRLSILVLTCSGALYVMGKAALTPKAANTQPSYSLPVSVPLPQWQPLPSKPLETIAESIASREYPYRRNAQSLTVALRYMVGDGDVNRFLFVFTPIRQANTRLVMKYQPGIGFYGVLPHQERAYLSACISPRGESTVTAQQFVQNHRTHDLTFDRLLPWLLGRQPLLDRRCLWTLMSVPLTAKAGSAELDTAYKTLENAWFDWYRWWRPNFPPL